MKRVLRFSGGVEREPAIEVWLDARPRELGAIARRWFSRLRACGPDVRELMHDGAPTACVEDAGFAYTNVYKAHVNVGFFHGASLPDPAGLLEGDGRYGRHVKLRPGEAADVAALEALVLAAYRDIKARLKKEAV
jgi:hypothetical protein